MLPGFRGLLTLLFFALIALAILWTYMVGIPGLT
jgi:hypothetical protein